MRVKKKRGGGGVIPNLLNEVDLVCVHDVHVYLWVLYSILSNPENYVPKALN